MVMELSSLPRTMWFSNQQHCHNLNCHLKENFLSLPVLIFHTKPFVFLRDGVFYTAAHTILFGKQEDNSFGDLKLYDTRVPCSWTWKQRHGSIVFVQLWQKRPNHHLHNPQKLMRHLINFREVVVDNYSDGAGQKVPCKAQWGKHSSIVVTHRTQRCDCGNIWAEEIFWGPAHGSRGAGSTTASAFNS